MPTYRHREQHRFHALRYGPRHLSRHLVTGTPHPHQRRHTARRFPSRRLLYAVGAVVVVVVGTFLVLGILAYRSVDSARNTMSSARALMARDLDDTRLFLSPTGRAEVAASITTVAEDANAASAQLQDSFALGVLGKVPFLSEQRAGIVALVHDVGTTAETGAVLLQRVDALADQSSGTSVSLPALTALATEVEHSRATMRRVDRPEGDLVGPIATARRQFDAQVGKMRNDLARGSQALGYAIAFLGGSGPRSYLIAGENNAEMRDQGDVLSVGVLQTQGGTFTMGPAQSVDDLEPAAAVGVPLPVGTAQIFGGYGPTQLWQSVNATAAFPLSARIMQAMYAQRGGVTVNGVVTLDVPALQSLLALTGPVNVPDIPGSITAANVGEVLLHEQYEQYPAVSLSGERHDNIAAVAKAVVDQLKTEHVDLAALANALAGDVAGRHLMVWDDLPQEETTIRTLGLSGSIDASDPGRTFHLAVENSTATKLDYYVDTLQDADVSVEANGDARVNTTITVTNTTPAGLGPTFQTGPDDINSFTPGQYVTRVVLWAPRGSFTPGSTAESGLNLVQSQLSVLPQQSKTVTFTTVIHHAVVHGHLVLRFVPQPRLVPPDLRIQIFAPGWFVTGPANVERALARTSTFTWSLSR